MAVGVAEVPITVLDRIHPNKHSHGGSSPKMGARGERSLGTRADKQRGGGTVLHLPNSAPGFCHLLDLCLGMRRERGERGERKLFRRT